MTNRNAGGTAQRVARPDEVFAGLQRIQTRHDGNRLSHSVRFAMTSGHDLSDYPRLDIEAKLSECASQKLEIAVQRVTDMNAVHRVEMISPDGQTELEFGIHTFSATPYLRYGEVTLTGDYVKMQHHPYITIGHLDSTAKEIETMLRGSG